MAGRAHMTVHLIPVEGIGEITKGDDLASVILESMAAGGLSLQDGDVVVVTHKIVSKAEGAVVAGVESEAEYRQVVERQAVSVLRRRGDLMIAETRHGFVCANAGVDRSNASPGTVVLLPDDPDRSAHKIRNRLEKTTGRSIGVVITDTFGRAWRRGVVDFAIGISGVASIVDYRGLEDMQGRVMEVTEVGIADEIAAAADLVMGKAEGIPVSIVRGLDLQAPPGRGADLVRPPEEDLFR
ncbi:MAG TPA: coenzyme F420-0:L-glutamate ligase [Acidimicrobiia bacterium]|nr:coenzyme F420-0:L-glutamate ligase [Acidimicrobiia bacterium]